MLVVKVRSGLVGQKNVANQNACHGGSNKAAGVIQHFVYGKEVVGSKIIIHPKAQVDAFELYQDTQVRTQKKHPTIYSLFRM